MQKSFRIDIDKKELDHALFKIDKKINCNLTNLFSELNKNNVKLENIKMEFIL